MRERERLIKDKFFCWLGNSRIWEYLGVSLSLEFENCRNENIARCGVGLVWINLLQMAIDAQTLVIIFNLGFDRFPLVQRGKETESLITDQPGSYWTLEQAFRKIVPDSKHPLGEEISLLIHFPIISNLGPLVHHHLLRGKSFSLFNLSITLRIFNLSLKPHLGLLFPKENSPNLSNLSS